MEESEVKQFVSNGSQIQEEEEEAQINIIVQLPTRFMPPPPSVNGSTTTSVVTQENKNFSSPKISSILFYKTLIMIK